MPLSQYMMQSQSLICWSGSGLYGLLFSSLESMSSLHSAAAALTITCLSCSLLFKSDMPSEYNTQDTNISYVLEENVHNPQQKQTLFFFFHLKNQTMFLQSISSCCSFHWLTCVHLHILSSPKPWIFTRYFGYIGKRVKGRRTYGADLQ